MTEQQTEAAAQNGAAPEPEPEQTGPVPVERFMGVVALIAAIGLAAMALDLMGVPVFQMLGLSTGDG
jgi:predicted lipid-binding transport protein (Tim44 family)